MTGTMTHPPDTLPPDAELALIAERVMRVKGTVVVGRVVCDELRLGDVLVAVGAERPICQGRVCGWEWYPRPPEVVRRGEDIALMFSHWYGYELPQDVLLYRVRRFAAAEQGTAADRGPLPS